MRCLICGDKAIGFNYDVLSCASCKAFFRRNAQSEIVKMIIDLFSIVLFVDRFRRSIDVSMEMEFVRSNIQIFENVHFVDWKNVFEWE